MHPIRVVLADDHPVVRKGIKGFLDSAEGISVVGEATSGEEALQKVKELSPDVLILDIELPGMSGIVVAQKLQEGGSPVKILVLSSYDNPFYIHEVMEMGAMGYLVKEETPESIVEAVRGVAHGENGWVSRRVAAKMMSLVRDENGDATVKFTRREMEVLRLVAEGKTNQNIAVALGISDKTVEKFLFSIFQKTGVASRTEAAVYAVREGIV